MEVISYKEHWTRNQGTCLHLFCYAFFFFFFHINMIAQESQNLDSFLFSPFSSHPTCPHTHTHTPVIMNPSLRSMDVRLPETIYTIAAFLFFTGLNTFIE